MACTRRLSLDPSCLGCAGCARSLPWSCLSLRVVLADCAGLFSLLSLTRIVAHIDMCTGLMLARANLVLNVGPCLALCRVN